MAKSPSPESESLVDRFNRRIEKVDAETREEEIRNKQPVNKKLAEADAFASLNVTRREALWAAKAIASAKPLPLFSQGLEGEAIEEPEAHLPKMTLGEEVVEDYVSTRLSLKAHPMALLRALLTPGWDSPM